MLQLWITKVMYFHVSHTQLNLIYLTLEKELILSTCSKKLMSNPQLCVNSLRLMQMKMEQWKSIKTLSKEFKKLIVFILLPPERLIMQVLGQKWCLNLWQIHRLNLVLLQNGAMICLCWAKNHSLFSFHSLVKRLTAVRF